MRELTSPGWIVAKGVVFLAIAAIGAVLLLAESPSIRTALLLAMVVWAACRFYYFLFYVLERYVDPRLRYAGLFALARALVARRSPGRDR
jgi:hypothetical protein